MFLLLQWNTGDSKPQANIFESPLDALTFNSPVEYEYKQLLEIEKSTFIEYLTPTEILNSKTAGYVYILADYNSFDTYKIGITKRPIALRVNEINQSPGSCIRLKYLSPLSEDYKAIEKKLHRYFKNNRTKSGENKSLSEWFYIEDLTNLKMILLYEFGTTFSDFPLGPFGME